MKFIDDICDRVVNCFQFVIWRSLTHRSHKTGICRIRCELLSICDLTIFDTPHWRVLFPHLVLWIAFNLWFDDLWHTIAALYPLHIWVVNCFQFVIWRSLTHQGHTSGYLRVRCELLSICDLTIFDTPFSLAYLITWMLWIAFNLWFDDLWHTFNPAKEKAKPVVNCFQFVIWRSLTHRKSGPSIVGICCELLSICDLTIFDTPLRYEMCIEPGLWIAFNLWFDDLWHTPANQPMKSSEVVNCFQFVIWRSLTHQYDLLYTIPLSCELLSICDLTIFDTPPYRSTTAPRRLWIAFNLWFDDLWHTWESKKLLSARVVNCFQFVIWRSLTHQSIRNTYQSISCELLSICDLTIFDTPGTLSPQSQVCCELLSICDLTIFDTPLHLRFVKHRQLWIAFNLWFDDLWHTRLVTPVGTVKVVNCFQFVIWRSLTHLIPLKEFMQYCCELLSICDLTIFDTPTVVKSRY